MVIAELFLIIFFIIVVIGFSPVGKVIVESYFQKKQNNELLQKYNDLSAKYLEHEEELQKLREIVIFNEDRIKKIESSNPASINKAKIQDQKEYN